MNRNQMHADPRVSVTIVNYNASDLLARCVGAVLASRVAVEVIVADNGSGDDSLVRLRAEHGADARLRILELHANLGFAAAHNRALTLTRAPYQLLLNPDCLVEPSTLELLADYLDTQPQVGMAGALVCDPDGAEQIACRRALPDPGRSLAHLLRLDRLPRWLWPHAHTGLDQRGRPLPAEPMPVEAISGACMFVRRAALEAVGPLDEGYFLHCEDLDWFMRFSQAGWQIAFVPAARVVHHKGACSSADPLAVERHKHRGMERYFRKFLQQRYPRAFGWLVIAGIRLHFWLLAALTMHSRLYRRQRAAP